MAWESWSRWSPSSGISIGLRSASWPSSSTNRRRWQSSADRTLPRNVFLERCRAGLRVRHPFGPCLAVFGEVRAYPRACLRDDSIGLPGRVDNQQARSGEAPSVGGWLQLNLTDQHNVNVRLGEFLQAPIGERIAQSVNSLRPALPGGDQCGSDALPFIAQFIGRGDQDQAASLLRRQEGYLSSISVEMMHRR